MPKADLAFVGASERELAPDVNCITSASGPPWDYLTAVMWPIPGEWQMLSSLYMGHLAQRRASLVGGALRATCEY